MSKTLHVIITGQVQEVGFRAFIRNCAMKNNVNGWVRNLDNGNVEAIFSGSQENLDKLIEITRRGTPWCNVSKVIVDSIDHDRNYTMFEIKT